MRKIGKRTCLIVDDDRLTRQVLQARLSTREGYQVVVAKDGHEGLKQVHRHHPDVVILDWNMPGSSGLEMLHKLRSKWATKDTPVFMLTGRGKMCDMETALQAGASGYFSKPIRMNELCKRMKLAEDRAQVTVMQ